MVHLARDHYRKGILIKDKISLSSHMLTFDDIKKIVILAFQITFCLENKSDCKGEFVFVIITEIF